MIALAVKRSRWAFRTPFRISYRTRSEAETVEVRLRRADHEGRGEASGVAYHGETADSLTADIERMRGVIEKGISRDELLDAMPAGGARSAIDCALWDLEAKEAGRRAWDAAGLSVVQPLWTSLTISLGDAEEMAEAAHAASNYRLLKLKLGGEGDVERVRSVRKARPDSRLIVDANQAWNSGMLHAYTPVMAELGVELIEQPLPAGADACLTEYDSPVPLCADESCQTRTSLAEIAGRYHAINIKLDKAGGLTEALALARAAKEQGLSVMAGCMAGSSLAIAPAFVLGQLCDFVDLDAPLLIAEDRSPAIVYDSDRLTAPSAELWG